MNPFARFLGIRNATVVSPLADHSHLETAVWAHLLGPDAQMPVSRADAMSVAAAAKGRHLIAGAIGRLPLIGMTGARITDDQPAILTQPEDGRPRSQTLTWIVDHLMWYGAAYLVITQRAAATDGGRPRRVVWVPMWNASVDTSTGALVAAWGKKVAPANVIRIDGPHEGLLTFAADRIRAARRLDHAALVASTNPVPQLELHQTSGTPLNADDARALVAAYEAQRKQTGVSYTNQSIETKVHGANSENLLIDGRKAAALDLARAMGLPSWAVDAPAEGQSMTYTNVPARARELIDYTFAPYMSAITDRLSMDDVLPRGQWCRFDTDPLLHDDFAARMASYKTAIESGVYTVADLRARELGTPLEESATA